MTINTIAYATLFQQALDKKLVEVATSGWMEANAGQVQYNGGAEVKIPQLAMSGLADYSRDEGFAQGAVTLTYQTLRMTMDRGRTFHLDAMDVNESNFVANASQVMAEFQRLMVVPEIDAYRYSKIYALANAAGKASTAYTPDVATILGKIQDDIAAIEDEVGEGEFVICMNSVCAAVLAQADELRRVLDVADFKKGDVTTKVRALDGNPILKVPSARMKTAYVFNSNRDNATDPGFAPDSGAKQINWIICPRNTPIAISKTDTVRIFEPGLNQKADAWKLDYRKYHDLWIPENRLAAVRVNIGV